MAQARSTKKAVKHNLFVRIGMFVKQTIDETRKVIAPHGKELFAWSSAVFCSSFLHEGFKHGAGTQY